jgi:hypothetical protein
MLKKNIWKLPHQKVLNTIPLKTINQPSCPKLCHFLASRGITKLMEVLTIRSSFQYCVFSTKVDVKSLAARFQENTKDPK